MVNSMTLHILRYVWWSESIIFREGKKVRAMLSLCGKFRFSFSLEVYTHMVFLREHIETDRIVCC